MIVGYLLVLAAASSWGTWPLIFHAAGRYGPMASSVQTAILMAVMAVSLVPLLARDRIRKRASWRHWLGIVWLGVGDVLNVLAFFAAYQRTSVAIAVMTHYLAPVFVAVVAPFALGEKPGPRDRIAVIVSLIGLSLLLQPWSQGLGARDMEGALLGALSAAFYASNTLVNKRINHVFSGTEMMCFHAWVALPLAFALVPGGQWQNVSTGSLVVVALGALGPGALGGVMFAWGLKKIPANHAATLTLMEPLVAVIGSTLFLGAHLSFVGVLGALCIGVGALAVVIRPRPVVHQMMHSP